MGLFDCLGEIDLWTDAPFVHGGVSIQKEGVYVDGIGYLVVLDASLQGCLVLVRQVLIQKKVDGGVYVDWGSSPILVHVGILRWCFVWVRQG